MTIAFDIPPHLERRFAEAGGDANRAAKEAALVELYRQGRLSHGELAEAMGISRYETDGLLKRHHVTEDIVTDSELAAQVEGLRRRLNP